MKRLFISIVAVLVTFIVSDAQTYLVNSHKPVKSSHYKAYPYNGPSSEKVSMSGGLDWYGGFTIGHGVGPYVPGFAEFDLGGKYETMMFVAGHETTSTGAGGSGISLDPAIVVIYCDGVKVRDGLIYPYGIPKRISLDVRGVNKVEFKLVQGYADIAFGEITLWKAGETPRETGNLITSKPKKIELTKDLMPYFQNYVIRTVGDRVESVNINGQTFEHGLKADMKMAIIGENPGWAYFNLRKQYSKLSFIAGPVDGDTHGSGWMTVKADGKIIWEWEMKHDDVAQQVTLDVAGCEILSFHTEHISGNLYGGFAKIMVYPEGEAVETVGMADAAVDPRLKALPDVCKLMSNVKPYSIGSQVDKQIYDGTSDYITFSMGGTKFSEGFVLYEKASFLDDNLISYVVFDLGHEFDYLSFTAGYLGKSWAMTNDILRVYADDRLVLETEMIATAPNKHFTIPLYKCRKLRFENQGSGRLSVGAFGVADLVLYRGEPVANNLFVHPRPECPYDIDLIDLGKPYIHYVSTKEDTKDEICYDGSTMKKYWLIGDRRVNEGFLLQTSTHFSFDFGPLSEGSDNAAAGVAGAVAAGVSFVPIGASVGGAVVGSTLIGAAALMALAAGGEAVENSCAAFNTYGEYNSVTFTVACYKPFTTGNESDYTETLWIGINGEVAAELTVYETMEPQTITIPIEGCEQLMFWLCNTGGTSGQYVFYDIKLTKDRLPLNIPKKARLSNAVVTNTVWEAPDEFPVEWVRPSSSNDRTIDDYMMNVSNTHNAIVRLLKHAKPEYEINTYFLETEAGQVCKAVRLMWAGSGQKNEMNIINEHKYAAQELDDLMEIRDDLKSLGVEKVNAALALPNLGFGAVSYGKVLKQANAIVDECKKLVNQMITDKKAELAFLDRLVGTAVDIDGKTSTEKTIFCPLFPGDEVPEGDLMMVEVFND